MKNILLIFLLTMTSISTVMANCTSAENKEGYTLGLRHGVSLMEIFGEDVECEELGEFQNNIISAISVPTSTPFQACRQLGILESVKSKLEAKSLTCETTSGNIEGKLAGIVAANEYVHFLEYNIFQNLPLHFADAIAVLPGFAEQCKLSFKNYINDNYPKYAPTDENYLQKIYDYVSSVYCEHYRLSNRR